MLVIFPWFSLLCFSQLCLSQELARAQHIHKGRRDLRYFLTVQCLRLFVGGEALLKHGIWRILTRSGGRVVKTMDSGVKQSNFKL